MTASHPGWNLDFSARTLLGGRELFVGDWGCAGGRSRSSREVARHVELGLQRVGAHVRAVGRDRRVVDPTIATLNAVGDQFLMISPVAPQRSTSVLVRGRLAEELVPRLRSRFAPVSPQTARLHARLHRATDPVDIEETALALLDRVLSDANRDDRRTAPSPSPARQVLAEEVQHLLATRFAERLTLEAIAGACGHSPFYISRVFRAVVGTTIHRHLTRVRLHAALFELRRSAGRLTQLALSVGFSSHSHFTQAFRAEFGCAPSELDAALR